MLVTDWHVINMQKMSPTSFFCHQHKFTNITVTLFSVPILTVKISDMATRLIRGILLFNPIERLKLKVITEKKHEWYSPNAIHKIMEAQLHENN